MVTTAVVLTSWHFTNETKLERIKCMTDKRGMVHRRAFCQLIFSKGLVSNISTMCVDPIVHGGR